MVKSKLQKINSGKHEYTKDKTTQKNKRNTHKTIVRGLGNSDTQITNNKSGNMECYKN